MTLGVRLRKEYAGIFVGMRALETHSSPILRLRVVQWFFSSYGTGKHTYARVPTHKRTRAHTHTRKYTRTHTLPSGSLKEEKGTRLQNLSDSLKILYQDNVRYQMRFPYRGYAVKIDVMSHLWMSVS